MMLRDAGLTDMSLFSFPVLFSGTGRGGEVIILRRQRSPNPIQEMQLVEYVQLDDVMIRVTRYLGGFVWEAEGVGLGDATYAEIYIRIRISSASRRDAHSFCDVCYIHKESRVE